MNRWLGALALVLATFAAYRPALDAGFVNWDDDHNVYANRHVTDRDGLSRIWFSADHYQYYPVVFTSFWLECHALGACRPPGDAPVATRAAALDARPFHRTNVLLHAANALLLGWLLHRLGVAGGMLAAFAFALHPVHVESVAWITERKNLLMGLFGLGCVHAQLRFERLRMARSYALALLFYGLALLSKAAASMLAPALLVLRWMRRAPLSRDFLLALLPYVALGAVLGLVSVGFERRQFEIQPFDLHLTALDRVALFGRVIWFYAGSLLWPADLMLVNPRWEIDAQRPLLLLYPLSALGAWALLFALRGPLGRGPVAALSLFVVLLLPASGLFDVYWMVFSWVADHFQYLASMPLLALLAATATRGTAAVASRAPAGGARLVRAAGLALAVAALALLGALTRAGSERFTDSRSLWEHAVASNPDAWIAHNYLGVTLADEGRFEEAIPHYRRTLELFPRHPLAGYNLGLAYARIGRSDLALTHYRRALAAGADNPRLHNNTGQLLAGRGEHGEALGLFRRAAALSPDWARPHENLGKSLAALGRHAEAADALATAARLAQASNPERAAALHRRAAEERGRAGLRPP